MDACSSAYTNHSQIPPSVYYHRFVFSTRRPSCQNAAATQSSPQQAAEAVAAARVKKTKTIIVVAAFEKNSAAHLKRRHKNRPVPANLAESTFSPSTVQAQAQSFINRNRNDEVVHICIYINKIIKRTNKPFPDEDDDFRIRPTFLEEEDLKIDQPFTIFITITNYYILHITQYLSVIIK